MSWPDSPEDLLAGPRGRRLCWETICQHGAPGLSVLQRLLMAGTGTADDQALFVTELLGVVAQLDRAGIARLIDESALLGPLANAVTAATYWQPPDEVDVMLATDPVSDALAPVAAAVTTAPASRWWATPIDRDRQVHVHFQAARGIPDTEPPALTGARTRLATWLAETADVEQQAAELWPDPSAPYSGAWWSTPALAGLVVTARSLPDMGAARLLLVEDSLGWQAAQCRLVRPGPDARVYEIGGSDDWAALVARYPLEVTRSRRHDWWRVTGWAGRWLIPDFAAVSADYDAVHLTVGGYLTTAGRALPVTEAERAGGDDGDEGGLYESAARTMLAGWDPDATYWLADVLTGAGPAVEWVPTEHLSPLGWIEAASRPG